MRERTLGLSRRAVGIATLSPGPEHVVVRLVMTGRTGDVYGLSRVGGASGDLRI